MPFTRPTLSTLRDRTANDIERYSDVDAHQRGSVPNAFANAMSAALHAMYGALDFFSKQLFDDTAEDEYILRRASVFGLTLIEAVSAQGNVDLTGNDGAAVPAGTQLQTQDGQTYTTDAEATISGGVATVAVTAVTSGADGNQNEGTTITFTTPVANVDASALVATGGLVGGADEESIDRLKERFAERKKTPPRGGCSDDYVAWAKQASVDVTRVWVFGNKDNTGATEYGAVTVYFVTDDLATPIPTAGLITTVDDYINQADIRPVGAKSIYTEAPVENTLNLTFTSLDPNTASVKQAIEDELQDLLKREAEPGGTILLSHIREAISIATGENDFTLTVPAADFTCAFNEFPVLGTITWP